MNAFTRAFTLAPVLAAALAVASLPASASGLPNWSAGEINANGTIGYGTGFTVQHPAAGEYVITYPTSTGFTSLPAVVVTPFGVSGRQVTWTVAALSGSNGGVQFTIDMIDKVGTKLVLTDNPFMFELMES